LARVAVVGAGQSAGEIACYPLRRPDVAEISAIGRRHLFTQTDNNPFVNDLHTYPGPLEFPGLPIEGRRRLLSDFRNTSFRR
jgi:L-ornithine N5-oxygenase